jgi:malate dehydrogenase (oxaloacetate-decarboxylating)(NADP+)
MRPLKDPLYIGTQQHRIRGAAYDNLIDEFVTAVQEVFPHALIQFKGLGDRNAFRALSVYRDKAPLFNDDIQGRAAVTLAGLYSILGFIGRSLLDQRFLFVGADQAGKGIADLVVDAMVQQGSTEADARASCWFFDSQGLVVSSRTNLAAYERHYAHDHEPNADLLSTINSLQPTAYRSIVPTGQNENP